MRSKPTTTADQSCHNLAIRRLRLILLTTILLCLAFGIDIMSGPSMLSISEVWQALFRSATDTQAAQHAIIVKVLRLPVAIFAILIGASLGLAGAQMQTILDNPLASPFTLGISAAAGFGAALGIIFGGNILPFAGLTMIPLSAFVFAILSSLLVLGISRLKHGTTDIIILSGVALLFLFNSALAFLQYCSSDDQLRAITFWMFGSLQGASASKNILVASVLLFAIIMFALDAWKLTALRLGDERARSMGINVTGLRLRTILLTAWLTATAVCFAGTIGFIGLVAPHLSRILVGEEQRYFMPLSILMGALLLSAASVVSKLLIPGIIFPIGIATSFVGVPFFLTLILSRKKRYP